MYPSKDSALQQQQLKVQRLVIPVVFTQGASSTAVGLKSDLPDKVGIRCGDSTQNNLASICENATELADCSDDSTDYVTASTANTNAIIHFLINLGDDTCKKIHRAQMVSRTDGTVKGTVKMADLSKGISVSGNIKLEFAETSLDLVDAALTAYNYCLIVEYEVA